MKGRKQKLRRSGAKIMASLILLLGSLAYIMILAVINGSIGFICAMGVTVFGAVGVAKALGETIALSYGWIIGLAVGCGLLRGLLRYFEQYSNHFIAFKLLAVLRDKIFGALRTLCPAKLESKQKGSIIAMITSDIETIEVFYAHTISPICIAILVSTAVFLFVGFVLSWYLAFLAVAGYLMIGIAVPIISSGRLKESGVKYRAEFASFNAYFLDSVKGIKDIVLNNAGKEREQEVNRRSELLLKETKKMKHNSTRASAATELTVSLFIIATLIAGIVLVRFDMLTIGKMIIAVVAVFGSFGPVIAISALPGNLTQTFASGDRILNLLAEEPAVTEVKNGENIEYEKLNVTGLSFSYDGQTQVLKDIKMHAEKGEIIGIVGESGCGKSTFLKLLLRFWQKEKGEIAYNGIDIDRIDSDNLLDNVTMVSQTTYLFDETIEENLRIAKPDASREELESACRLASIHDFIMTLPNGYKTQVGALGDNLSAGEKQRIGLARAFLKGSDLILLDEPTSNVDSINEGIILKALKEQKSKKSIILVSHRESTMAIADRIYRADNGQMQEVKV
ncbi:ABC transporter ATP-binding protein [Candidatus Borkfalkia ceftriaxoniphila]|uniref:ABC transporter ATP-binding protein n=1 Tax=Candidatus Borkfalkia ceftriaxoniphila TaxID=2508949 RepID=A0A4Q2K8I6_9FIRM|nr:ABC transporter ATP-binding protein [Candidatus Borkfalkia ceftriaxoniphila]RXZ58303.1 ABC transporter ATP-binding protein [Candidatus Borkfalkia ceftriaxoniphila]